MQSTTIHVSVEEIRLGAKCNSDIADERGVLLLGKGVAVTKEILDLCCARGIQYLELTPEDARSLTGSTKRVPTGSQNHLRPRELRTDRGREPYSLQRHERFQVLAVSGAKCIASAGREEGPITVDMIDRLRRCPHSFLEMLADDADQSIAVFTESFDRHDSLAQRCLAMSLLAMNTGVEMDFDEQNVHLLGIAGLLHDFGLFRLPQKLRNPSESLNDFELETYRKHSFISMDTFSRYSAIPTEACVLMNQVHERPDGSGYPRGLRKHMLHPLAKILSIVDAYLTMILPGPGRPPLQPHDAIVILLHGVTFGLFDAAVTRAFLNLMTLFPIGSFVELSDGKLARVLRRNGNHYANPIVRFDNHETVEPMIADGNGLRILKSLPDPAQQQMSIDRDMVPELAMEFLK